MPWRPRGPSRPRPALQPAVSVPDVDLGLTRAVAAARVHHVVRAGTVEEDGALGEGLRDLVRRKVDDVRCQKRCGRCNDEADDRPGNAHHYSPPYSSAATPALATSSSRCW